MLTENQLKLLYQQLLEMKEDLIETIQGEIEDEESPFNVSGDMADKAGAITYVSVSEGLTQSQKITLEKIDRAIKRIEDGIYGKCLVCNNSIESDRLEAIPYAETCKEHMK
ncbi:MAG: TraR/DksA family transcriptional regulator [Brevinemataceae bacterium]